MSTAYLILADGTVFEGCSIGAEGKTIGETVFTTGMTGYLETLTDPSYFGQIVTQTFPLIGNYGVESADAESGRSYVRGYIVRELCDYPSNFRSEGSLDAFLKEQGIVGICGIDTRALTKRLRASGVMNGMIVSGPAAADLSKQALASGSQCSESNSPAVPEALLTEIRAYSIKDAVKSVSHAEGAAGAKPAVTETPSEPASRPARNSFLHVALLDFGAKANIRRELKKRGCRVSVLPYNTSAEEILRLQPDGIMLSNGPGDPAENVAVIEEIRKLCQSGIPLFGICLGHQMLALARGARTSKLAYGHRGGNHPVKETASGRVYITSQNHGYAVEADSLPPSAAMSFVNANDGTCEGVTYSDIPAFSVQFHPEACGGPHDTNFLFDRFLEMMKHAIE